MKKSSMFILALAVLLVLSGCEQAVPSAAPATVIPATTVLRMQEATPTITVLQTMLVPTPTIRAETPQATASALASIAPSPTPAPSHTVNSTPKPTPKATMKVSITKTPKPASTPKPTTTQESSGVTPMSSAYKNAVLSGINYVRTHNGEYAADAIDNLDSALSAKAQKHAEEMAAKGEIFHSSWGPESVSCGDLENGESAGVRSAAHAAGLLDPEITRIGVGAARSADGTIYLCVDGAK